MAGVYRVNHAGLGGETRSGIRHSGFGFVWFPCVSATNPSVPVPFTDFTWSNKMLGQNRFWAVRRKRLSSVSCSVASTPALATVSLACTPKQLSHFLCSSFFSPHPPRRKQNALLAVDSHHVISRLKAFE